MRSINPTQKESIGKNLENIKIIILEIIKNENNEKILEFSFRITNLFYHNSFNDADLTIKKCRFYFNYTGFTDYLIKYCFNKKNIFDN